MEDRSVNNLTRTICLFAAGAICVGLIGYCAWFIGGRFFELEKDVATLAVVAVVTLVYCSRNISTGFQKSRKIQVAEALRTRRAAIYERLLANLLAAYPSNVNGARSADELESSPSPIEIDLLLWGSARTIACYCALRRGDCGQGRSLWQSLVDQMRKDLEQARTAVDDFLPNRNPASHGQATHRSPSTMN